MDTATPLRNLTSTVLLSACLALMPYAVQAQQRLSGTVNDIKTGETLVGATVVIKGTNEGTVTDINGRFELETRQPFPLTLGVTYVGYDTAEVLLKQPGAMLRFHLNAQSVGLKTIDIRGNRISEERQKEPLTMETMDLFAIRETPATSFYDGLGNLTGVDITTASLGFKVINTRGFNSTSPVRSLQIIDGVDNQSPGLNFSLGNFLGAPELDVLKVDIVQGAASPFFGPNAFNGVISMTSKDPFVHTGLTTMVKVGERNLVEGAMRWAKVYNNSKGLPILAYKANFSYMRANDWEAVNYGPVDQSPVGGTNPGRYDAVNIYGDEYFPLNDFRTAGLWGSDAGLGLFHRTGYREADLVDYNSWNLKAGLAASLRTAPESKDASPKLVLASNFGSGTTVYQGDNRFSLRGIKFWQNRIEYAKDDHYFIRIYATHEHSGRSFDPYFTAIQLQNEVLGDEHWAMRYRQYWISGPRHRMRALGYPDLEWPNPHPTDSALRWLALHNDSLRAWHLDAARFADNYNGGRYEPGTPEFKEAFGRITSQRNNAEQKGTLFYDRSALYHAHSEYRFTPSFLKEIRVGASGRYYTPKTDGTIFSDTAGNRITNYEFGLYSGAVKELFSERLSLALTGRMDKNENFSAIFTPAASVVWNPAKDHYLRLSFSSALRNPTLSDQYLHLNVGRAILAGNLAGADSLITLESFHIFRDSRKLGDLEYFSIGPVRPERVKTYEAGYRGILHKVLYADITFYYNRYNDFLGYMIGIDGVIDPASGIPTYLQVYRFAANSTQQITTMGANISLRYYWRHYVVSANYNRNRLHAYEDDPIIPAFNTPEHKVNIGLNGRNLPISLFGNPVEGAGFAVNYKWVEGFLFEGSPQFTGLVPAFHLLDAQVSWRSNRLNSTFKLGGTNLLNLQRPQTFGGPNIGRLVYLGATYELRACPKK